VVENLKSNSQGFEDPRLLARTVLCVVKKDTGLENAPKTADARDLRDIAPQDHALDRHELATTIVVKGVAIHTVALAPMNTTDMLGLMIGEVRAVGMAVLQEGRTHTHVISTIPTAQETIEITVAQRLEPTIRHMGTRLVLLLLGAMRAMTIGGIRIPQWPRRPLENTREKATEGLNTVGVFQKNMIAATTKAAPLPRRATLRPWHRTPLELPHRPHTAEGLLLDGPCLQLNCIHSRSRCSGSERYAPAAAYSRAPTGRSPPRQTR